MSETGILPAQNTTENSQLAPVEGGAPAPNFAAAAPASPPSSTASGEAPIVVGGESYTPAQLEQLIEAGRAVETRNAEIARREIEIRNLQESVSDAVQLAETWNQLAPEIQQRVLTVIEQGQSGNVPAAPGGNAPEIAWADLSDEGRMLYAQVHTLRSDLAQLVRAVRDMSGQFQEVAQRDRDALIAQGLRAKGIEATPEIVAQLRSNGISDPLKAIDALAPILKRAEVQGAKAAATAPKPPAEPGAATQTDTYDDTDPNLTADQELAFLMRGMVPASSTKR